DPTRSPPGTESLWAYTHVPQSIRGDAAGEIGVDGQLRGDALAGFVERMQARIEAHAPGFGARVIARHVQGPADLEAADASLVGRGCGRSAHGAQRVSETTTDIDAPWLHIWGGGR